MRNVGISSEEFATAYRAVFLHTTEKNEHRRYAGIYDTPGPARALVTARLAEWAAHLIDFPEESVVFDAWVEVVRIVNFEGIRV